MSNAMLGAEIGGLSLLADRLGTTTSEIGSGQAECQEIQTTVCGEMEAAFATAITRLSTTREDLNRTVHDAARQLADTNWTGANRANFEGAYTGFSGAMTNLNGAIDSAYQQFKGNMEQMNAMMEAFQGEVATSLVQAQESTASMQQPSSPSRPISSRS